MTARSPDPRFWEGKAVSVTGGAGFLGTPTVRMLAELGARVAVPRSSEHDLTDRAATSAALEGSEIVIHLAATVGGIGFGRTNPAVLARDNLAMGLNVFEACRELDVGKLVAACSVCAYPKHAPVPFREEGLWDGYPEETNAPYGLAKKMLIVLSESYRAQFGLNSCVPVIANLYGPGDDYDLENSHVVAGMIRRYVEAQEKGDSQVVLWGTGEPSRELLYVDDAARALILAAEHVNVSDPFNVGTGEETKIAELARMVSAAVGYRGETVWDTTRPDGQRVRYLDVSRARELMGFEARVRFEEGLAETIARFRDDR